MVVASSSYTAGSVVAAKRRAERQRATARRSAAAGAPPLDESLMCMIGDDARVPPHHLVDAVTLTECLHFFCRRCLLKRLRRDRHCPKCHQDLSADYSGDDALQRLVYRAAPDHFWRQMRRYWRRRGRGGSGTPSVDECRRMREMAERLCADDERVSLALDYVPMRRVLCAERVDDAAATSVAATSSTYVAPLPLLAEFTDDDEDSKSPEIGISAPAKTPQGLTPAAASSTPSAKLSGPLLFRRYFRCAASTRVGTLRKLLERKLAAENGCHIVYIVDENDANAAILADNVTLRELIYSSGWRREAPFRVAFTLAQCATAEEDDDDGEKPPVLDAEEVLPQPTTSAVSGAAMSSPSTSTVSPTIVPLTKAAKDASTTSDAENNLSGSTTDDVDLARHWRPNVPRLSIQASALDPACRPSNGAILSIITATTAPTTASTTSAARSSLKSVDEAAKRRRKSTAAAKVENGTALPSRKPSKPAKVRKLVDHVKSDVKPCTNGAGADKTTVEAVASASSKEASDMTTITTTTTTANNVTSTTATTVAASIVTTTNITKTTSGDNVVEQLKQQNLPPKMTASSEAAATAAKAVTDTNNTNKNQSTTVLAVISTETKTSTINATAPSPSSCGRASTTTYTSTTSGCTLRAPTSADNGPTSSGPKTEADESAQSSVKSSGSSGESQNLSSSTAATTAAVPKSTSTPSRATPAKNNNNNNNNNSNNYMNKQNNSGAEIFNQFVPFGAPTTENSGMLGGVSRSGASSSTSGSIVPSGPLSPTNLKFFNQFCKSLAFVASLKTISAPVISEGNFHNARMRQQQAANNTAASWPSMPLATTISSTQSITGTTTATSTNNSKRKPSSSAISSGSAPKRSSPPKPRQHHQLPTMVPPPPTSMVYGSHAAAQYQPPPSTYDLAGAAHLCLQKTLLNAATVGAANGGANKGGAVVSNAT